jgi:hypothetical protein
MLLGAFGGIVDRGVIDAKLIDEVDLDLRG